MPAAGERDQVRDVEQHPERREHREPGRSHAAAGPQEEPGGEEGEREAVAEVPEPHVEGEGVHEREGEERRPPAPRSPRHHSPEREREQERVAREDHLLGGERPHPAQEPDEHHLREPVGLRAEVRHVPALQQRRPGVLQEREDVLHVQRPVLRRHVRDEPEGQHVEREEQREQDARRERRERERLARGRIARRPGEPHRAPEAPDERRANPGRLGRVAEGAEIRPPRGAGERDRREHERAELHERAHRGDAVVAQEPSARAHPRGPAPVAERDRVVQDEVPDDARLDGEGGGSDLRQPQHAGEEVEDAEVHGRAGESHRGEPRRAPAEPRHGSVPFERAKSRRHSGSPPPASR